jgi:hypothetical protein
MSAEDFLAAVLQNQEVSRDVMRVIALRLWPTIGSLSGRDETAFWDEVTRRWREWIGGALPYDDLTWRRLAHRLGLVPPETIDANWLQNYLLPALLAKQEGLIEPPTDDARKKTPGKGKKRRPGRPRRNQERLTRQTEIAAKWKRFYESKCWQSQNEITPKEQFCEQEEIEREELETALRSTRSK